MAKKVTISLLQMKITPGKVEKNLMKASALLETARKEGAEIAVLPEMFSSGFYYQDLAGMADESPSVLLSLKGMCKDGGISLLFSVPEKDGSAIYNTAYIIGGDGKIKGKYRKVHLFGLFQEDRYFSGGNATVLRKISSFKVAPLICYDLRFPEISRKMTLMGAEIIAYCSQWPRERVAHWNTLLKARAIENQVFVVATNGCGKSGKIHLAGHSLVISPFGETLLDCGSSEGSFTVALDEEQITHFRRTLPCLRDRRPEVY